MDLDYLRDHTLGFLSTGASMVLITTGTLPTTPNSIAYFGSMNAFDYASPVVLAILGMVAVVAE